MNTATLRQHIAMETEGEMTPMQWRTYAYVEPTALEYRAGIQVPAPGSESPRPDGSQPHVARARREACIAAHSCNPADLDDLARAGLPGVELLRDADRAEEQIPSLSRRQAD